MNAFTASCRLLYSKSMDCLCVWMIFGTILGTSYIILVHLVPKPKHTQNRRGWNDLTHSKLTNLNWLRRKRGLFGWLAEIECGDANPTLVLEAYGSMQGFVSDLPTPSSSQRGLQWTSPWQSLAWGDVDTSSTWIVDFWQCCHLEAGVGTMEIEACGVFCCGCLLHLMIWCSKMFQCIFEMLQNCGVSCYLRSSEDT